MPNWCENELIVKGGEVDELLKFSEFGKTKKSKLDENQFVPYPEKFKKIDEEARAWEKKADEYARNITKKQKIAWYCGDLLTDAQRKAFTDKNGEKPKDGYNLGGYEWCCANWGTKWGLCEVSGVIYKEKKKLVYNFDTAWSPPEPLIKKMAEMFPQLEFALKFWEGGMGFKGVIKFKGKDILQNDTFDYAGYKGG